LLEEVLHLFLAMAGKAPPLLEKTEELARQVAEEETPQVFRAAMVFLALAVLLLRLLGILQHLQCHTFQ
jgi:hypothetical protein